MREKKMTKEEKLRIFYREIKNLTEEKKVNSEVAFLEMICTLFLGKTLNRQEDSIYDYLLVWNLTYDEYKRKGFTDEALYPFNLIDKKYYQELRQNYNTEEHRSYQTYLIGQLVKDLAFDEENMLTLSIKEENPEREEIFNTIKQIIKEVQENASISIEAISLIALSNAYFRLYKPSLDKKKVEEKILTNKVDKILKKKKEVSKTVMNSEEETKEEKFVSILEKVDSVLNSSLSECSKKEELFEKIIGSNQEYRPLLTLFKNK